MATTSTTIADVQYPFGNADVQAPAYAATIAATITDQMTIISPAQLTGALTLNLTINSGVRAGARILFVAVSDGTARTTTFGTGFTSPTLAGVISKTKAIEFVYDGTTFKATSVGVQID